MLIGHLATVDHNDALLREAYASGQFIDTYLMTAGFDGIPRGGPLLLRAVAAGGGRARDLARVLGIIEQEVDDAISTLVEHGYLRVQARPGGLTGSPLVITERGRAANHAAMTGFKAARWADFPFRQGDIVVSTWPKTGTAWVQMVCALLVFQIPELPKALSELSPWLDDSHSSRDQVYARLAAQEHRRIIKTHLPLNDIPVDPRATYITIGRHPLDAALSLYHQNNNQVTGPDEAAPGQRGPDQHRRRPASAAESLLRWIDLEASPQDGYHYLSEMLRHLSAAWTLRDQPNVVLVHYEDLSANLDGEIRRIAARLGITVPDAIWPSLVKAATFEHMRANPDRFVTPGLRLQDNATFFRKGESGEGRALLSRAELVRYQAHVAPLAPSGLLAWLHHDNGAERSGDPR